MADTGVRPTLLLRFVITAASLGAFLGVLALAGRSACSLAVAAVVLAFWLLGLELGFLPWLLERVVMRWAGFRVSRSTWLIDIPEAGRYARRRHRNQVRDNPALW